MISNTLTYSFQPKNVMGEYFQERILLYMTYYLVLIIGFKSTYLDKKDKFKSTLINNIGRFIKKFYSSRKYLKNLNL